MPEAKILVVDDEPEFVDVVQTVLEGSGYDVVTAGSGEEGKQKALDEEPDLIILDVMMETDKAGFEVARWLRSEEVTERIPIVMLTAVNQKYPFGFTDDDIWLPVDKFLEKPVSPDKLLEEVEGSLEGV
jgi:CheY-like chemotaxis protein